MVKHDNKYSIDSGNHIVFSLKNQSSLSQPGFSEQFNSAPHSWLLPGWSEFVRHITISMTHFRPAARWSIHIEFEAPFGQIE